jgi:hypothetical protein
MLRTPKIEAMAVLVNAFLILVPAEAQDYTAAVRAAWCAGAERQWIAEMRANPPVDRQYLSELVGPIGTQRRCSRF